jgi:hypothetical protein
MKVRASLISHLGPLGRRSKGGPRPFREVDMKAKSVRQSPSPFCDRRWRCAHRIRQRRSCGARKVHDELAGSGRRRRVTGQHAFDVGDVPGHQVRIFEVRRTFTNDHRTARG